MVSKRTGRQCALYLRISQDREGDGLAHDRQREDCERIIRERGWQLVETYADTISAYDRRKRRPSYEQMVQDYATGRFDAIVCWDLDRLTRQPRQLEDWIEAAEERGLALVTANGEADLTTDGGRMYARIKAAVARGEMDRKAARQSRAIAQRVERGKVPAGVRLTGYTGAGKIIPGEAAVIRRIFTRFNAGDSLNGIARDLNNDGVSARRSSWSPSSVRTILLNPRYCGRQVFEGKATGHLGEWTAIVSEATFDTAQGILGDPRRLVHREGTDRKHLGSGLYLCGTCDRPVRSVGERYRCKEGHITRTRVAIDDYVHAFVAAWLRSDKVGQIDLSEPTAANDAADELTSLRRRLEQVERDYDDDVIDGRRYKVKRDKLLAAMTSAERANTRGRASSALTNILGTQDPVSAFMNAPLGIQRTVLSENLVVRLLPAPRGRKGFDPATVAITPVEAAS